MLLRTAVRGMTVAGAVASVSPLAVSPAAAMPYWQKWVPTSDHECGPTVHHWKSVNVLLQACVIHGSGKNMRTAILVRSDAGVDIQICGRVHDEWNQNEYSCCHGGNLSVGALTACYGQSSSGNPLRARSVIITAGESST